MQPLPLDRLIAARRGRGLVAVFDLDGTLAPIARRPAEARVPPAVRRALRALGRRRDTLVGVVSGRPLAQMERLLGRRGPVWLVGLHGAVRYAPGRGVRRLWSAASERQGRELAAVLRAALRGLSGVWVERKGPITAVHLRRASPAARRHATLVVARRTPPRYRLLAGRRVLELLPRGFPTKADAVRWIAGHRPGAVVLCAGDDATDEDAFRVLGRGDFAVRVDARRAAAERGAGAVRSHARYVLAGPSAVGALVRALVPHDRTGPKNSQRS